MNRLRPPAWSVALIVLVVAVAVAVAVRSLGQQEGTMTIQARFSGTPGLYEGNRVRVLGVAVGTVEKIEPAGASVVVTLRVPETLKIPEAAHAVIVPASLVTDRYVELTPAYTGGALMQPNAVIPASRTRTPVEFGQVIKAVTDLSGDLVKINKGSGVVSRFLRVSAENARGNGPALRRAISDTAEALGVFARNRGQVGELVTSLADLASALAASDDTVKGFARSLTDATDFLAEDADDLNAALAATLAMVLDVEKFVRENRARLTEGVDGLAVTAHTLVERAQQLAEAVDTFPLAGQNAERAYDDELGGVRIAAEIYDGVLTVAEAEAICRELARLPACSAVGGVLSLGSDLGLTELLLDLVAGGIGDIAS